MESLTTRNVSDLPLGERTALEQLLGKPLTSEQAVFVMAFSPGRAEPSARAEARKRLEQQFQAQGGNGAAAAEADAAVEEAMLHVRRRSE